MFCLVLFCGGSHEVHAGLELAVEQEMTLSFFFSSCIYHFLSAGITEHEPSHPALIFLSPRILAVTALFNDRRTALKCPFFGDLNSPTSLINFLWGMPSGNAGHEPVQ